MIFRKTLLFQVIKTFHRFSKNIKNSQSQSKNFNKSCVSSSLKDILKTFEVV